MRLLDVLAPAVGFAVSAQAWGTGTAPTGPLSTGPAGTAPWGTGGGSGPTGGPWGTGGGSGPTGGPSTVYTTTVVSTYVTYCPEPTTFAFHNTTYTVTRPITLTITNCPCTLTIHTPPPVTTTTTYVVPPPVNTQSGGNGYPNTTLATTGTLTTATITFTPPPSTGLSGTTPVTVTPSPTKTPVGPTVVSTPPPVSINGAGKPVAGLLAVVAVVALAL